MSVTALIVWALAGMSAIGSEENVAFPPDAGVVNVKAPPYSARGDGVADDTQAIQAAISDHMKGGTLYFPNGIYLVSSTLTWSKKNSRGEDCWGNFTIQGQSAAGTVIRLKDGTFRDPQAPKAIMWCGGFGSADWFHNYVKNMTFDVGRDNPGAVGLQFYSNNTGAVRDVRIISQDGDGVIGLDLGHRDMNGPLLVKNLLVQGFAIGVQTGHSVNSQVFEHLRLQGQTVCGFSNDGQSVSIRGLTVAGALTAVRNTGPGSFMVLLDSTLEGPAGSENPAIESEASLFARNVHTSGYRKALATSRGQPPDGMDIGEFVSEPVLSLFPTPERSLNLPIKETPELPRDPVERWVSVKQFHRGGVDYSPAIQAAIDSGATTVYFPFGDYKIGQTVIVRGKVRRLVGMNSWFAESAGDIDDAVTRFRIEDGEAPVVVIESFRGGFGGRVFIEYATNRTLVVKECDGIPSAFRGSGEIYLEDTTASPHGGFLFAGRQKVWARQFNVENFINEDIAATLDNRGSDIWILGLKTEQGNRLVATRDAGRTEILGGLVYTINSHQGRPAFINEESSFSMSIRERCFMGTPMDPVVRETRDGVTRDLGQTSVIGLYVGYEGTASDGPWEKSSSIPIGATIEPAVSDQTVPLDPGKVEVAGLVGERIRAHASNRILHIDEDVLLAGFRSRPGSHPWIGEHVGKWLHAASLLWLGSQDAVLREKITRIAKGLIATQGEDGYLGTYVPEKRLGLYPGAAWDGVNWNDSDWDVWVHKCCLIGLLSYYGISGDEEALRACKRAGDLLASTFPAKRSILIAGTHAGMAPTSVLEPIVLLYRATGEKRYLDFAMYIVRSWDEPDGPRILSAMLKEKTVLAVGNRKAYEMLSNYVGLCELYRATAKAEFLQAAQYAWEDVSSKRLYITGGSSVGEHFQQDGYLPNDSDAHIQETCVTTTWIQLCWQLLRLTGEEKYAASLEQALFNQILGAQKPDGSGFGYYIPLEGQKPFRPDSPGTRGMDCCNSSGPRALGLAPTFLGMTDANGFRINTFAPAKWHLTIDRIPVTITLKSRFPSDAAGTIEIDPQKKVDFRLALRIPRWADVPRVAVGDETLPCEPGTYLSVRRTWRRDDVVRFSFSFTPQVHLGAGSNEGRVAVTAGPLVLTLDRADNPEIDTPQDIALASLMAEDLRFESRPAKGRQSWPDETLWTCNVRDLAAATRGEEPVRRGVLRPFSDAGSWDATRYAVWLKTPGAAAGRSHGTARARATEDVVFPADAGVVDVSRPPYSVPGDGKTDVTAALQKALDDHPSSNRIIYLPNGTYIIGDTLRWPTGSHGGVEQKRVILQGQSRDGTVIRLKDRCRGFGDANAPKAMVWTGKAPAQRFRNGIRNLTFHTGRGNPGAIGVQYIANNQGSLRQVRIVGNETGPIGLDLGYTDEQGPCLIQDVEVDGFDVGISMRHTVDSITLERIVVRNQRVVGVLNGGQCVSLRGLESINDVPAVKNEGMYSVMTLLDSTLSRREGDSDVAAVENSGVLFARGLETAGYRTAIRNEVGEKTSVPGGQVDEFVSHPPFALFETPKQSLDLPVEETPRVTSRTLVDWVSPLEFGGTADGRDCTEVVQKAVDSGRRVLYFPYGNWRIDGTVQIRGAIEIVTALEGRLRGNGKLKVVEGTAPVVTIERMDLLYQQLSIEHASSRPVVISGVTFGGSLEYTGSGPLFLEDVCVGTVRLGQGQEVWARQLNCEAGDQTKVINDGGTLWIQGLKTEKRGTICQTLHGGRTEIVGGLIYSNQSIPEGQPMFTVEDAAFSATVGESNFSGKPYPVIAQETQAGVEKALPREKALRRGGASMLPLFVAHLTEQHKSPVQR